MNTQTVRSLVSQIRSLEAELLRNPELLHENEEIQELKTCVDDFRTTLWMTMLSHLPESVDKAEFLEMIKMRRITEMMRSVSKRRRELPVKEKAYFGFNDLMQIAETAFCAPSTVKPHGSRDLTRAS